VRSVGKTRSCDARCHNAKQPACDCWCAGHFHGAAGADNRKLFLAAFSRQTIPTTHEEYEQVLQQPRLALVEASA